MSGGTPTPEGIEEQARRIREEIDRLKRLAVRDSTWGVFFALVGIIALIVAIILLLEALSGGSATAALVAAFSTLLADFIMLLEYFNEKGLLERVRELQKGLEKLGVK